MNLKKTILLVLLPAALSLGCIAQAGGPEDPGSSNEALTNTPEHGARGAQAQPQQRSNSELPQAQGQRDFQGAPSGLETTTSVDSKQTDDGDGNDPTPVPWRNPPSTFAQHK